MSKTTCHQKNPERLNFGGSLRKLNDIDMMLGTWAHTDTHRERERGDTEMDSAHCQRNAKPYPEQLLVLLLQHRYRSPCCRLIRAARSREQNHRLSLPTDKRTTSALRQMLQRSTVNVSYYAACKLFGEKWSDLVKKCAASSNTALSPVAQQKNGVLHQNGLWK